MTEHTAPSLPVQADYATVHADIVALLEAARRAAARSVNALMTASYWEIGRRIVEFEQGGKERAVRGQHLLQRLSQDLGQRFGRGFSVDNLEQMRLFYLAWPADKIFQTLSGKSSAALPPAEAQSEALSRNITLEQLARALPLSWSHYVRLVRGTRSAEERDFYEAEALRGGWFRVDLLFFHRRLRCLVIVDLKLGELSHADVGQMHMYCNYAREHWMLPDENPPVGLILCARAKSALARYALEGLPNKVMAAQYQTVLPDVKLLEAELEKTQRELEARREGMG